MEERKSDFQQKLDAQINELESKLDNLKLKAKDATADAKVKYNELIDDLEPKIAEGKAKLKATFRNVKDRFDGDDDDEVVADAEEPKVEEQ